MRIQAMVEGGEESVAGLADSQYRPCVLLYTERNSARITWPNLISRHSSWFLAVFFVLLAACNQSKKLKHLLHHPLLLPSSPSPLPSPLWERCCAKKHCKAKKAFAYSARNANQPFLCLAMWNMHELRGQIGELGNKPWQGQGQG